MESYNVKDYTVFPKKIGVGAFSSIHKATKKNSEKIYAIKKIDIYKYKNSNRETYKREFSLLRKLDHKNIIKLHDIIIDKNSHNMYLALDYYKNGDLSKFLNNRSLKEKFAKKYMFQLRDGIQYLFSKNIIHRDLKPQNILLDDNFNLIITDFGLAKHFQNNEMMETMCGSPLYMAPEIMKRENYSIQSDLWSLGVILYQMLYAKLPYFSKSMILLNKEINTKSVDYTCIYKISDDCTDLIKSMLVKDPKERISWDAFFNHLWFTNDELLEHQNNLMEISISNFSFMKNNITSNESQFNSFIYKSIKKKNKLEDSFELDMNDDDDTEDVNYMSCDENEVEIEPNLQELSKTVSLPINIKNTYVVVNKNITLPNSDHTEKSISDSFRDYLSHSIEFVKNSYEYLSHS
jgi:serine/threonine protein kinase